MVAESSGNIKLIGYNILHTLSNECRASITSVDVSGNTTTPPYSVEWSGSTNSYSAATFDIINLCSGWYEATITDYTGATGTTLLLVSGLTVPSIVGTLSNTDCILDTNKLGAISVTTSKTETSSFRYELIKNGTLLDTHYGTSADTTHTFTDIENGMYTVTVIEDRPLVTDIKYDNTGCTSYNYNDGNAGESTAGWNLNTLSATTISWTPYIPNAPYDMNFTAGWGPATGGADQYYDTGLGLDGKIYSSNPYVWFYTGSTASRLTDTTADWYLGTSGVYITEGGNLGPTITSDVANIGKFYYNTVINKFLYWYPAQGAGYAWRTVDPREDYGIYGNPVAVSGLTGTTYGITITDVNSSDYSVNSGGTVAVATGIVLEGGASQLYASTGNNSAIAGKLSMCSYLNYTWELTFRSEASIADDDGIGITIASFRDTEGRYGPSGVTHTLDMVMNGASGNISIFNNYGMDAYGFNKYQTPIFRNCNGGCSAPEDTNFGLTTILAKTASQTPFTSGTNWVNMGATRVKISRYGNFGEFFTINFTDTMGATAAGAITKGNTDANPYNANFTIDLNLLDKSTWTGNGGDAPSWVDNYALCKFLGSKRIGFWSNSQDNSRFYHMQFTGGTLNQYLIGPRCGKDDGPKTTIEITATTATTANISTTKCKPKYNPTNKGVPIIKPRLNVTLQEMPTPNLTINGLSKPSTTVKTQRGDIPSLDVYNLSKDKGINVQFYYGGNNQDMVFDTLYPKFRVFPYIFQTEEVAQAADYEAIFDTMPSYVDKGIQSLIMSASTYIPLSGLSTETSWEFIIRPSYLFKDKTAISDIWVDTATYPTESTINYNKDFYLVLVDSPNIPTLYLEDFKYPVTNVSQLVTETTLIQQGSGAIPDITATTYSSSTMVYTLQSPTVSKPMVIANGVVLKEGASGGTAYATTYSYGDYTFNTASRSVIFNPETVQVGDELQFIYDANGGSYTQFITVPTTVTTTTTESIFEENGYYYLNLDKQSIGSVSLAINGVTQTNEKSYRKVSDTRVQLVEATSNYKTGDVIALFYNTIYQLISRTISKEPEIPVTYIKSNTLIEEIVVRLFDSTGNKVQELIEKIDVSEIGNINRSFTLLPPGVGYHYYYVLIRRYYPLIGGQTITTESQSETIGFNITRDVFYSPVKTPRINNNNMGDLSPY